MGLRLRFCITVTANADLPELKVLAAVDHLVMKLRHTADAVGLVKSKETEIHIISHLCQSCSFWADGR